MKRKVDGKADEQGGGWCGWSADFAEVCNSKPRGLYPSQIQMNLGRWRERMDWDRPERDQTYNGQTSGLSAGISTWMSKC